MIVLNTDLFTIIRFTRNEKKQNDKKNGKILDYLHFRRLRQIPADYLYFYVIISKKMTEYMCLQCEYQHNHHNQQHEHDDDDDYSNVKKRKKNSNTIYSIANNQQQQSQEH